MKHALYRSFRFGHPVFDRDASGLAETPGLSYSALGVDMVEDEASIRQALMLLLSTVPGERVMRPSYGCDLYLLAFAVNDETTAGLAMHYVRRAIQTWEPRVELLHLNAERDPAEPGRLNVSVDYRIRRSLKNERVSFPLSLVDPR